MTFRPFPKRRTNSMQIEQPGLPGRQSALFVGPFTEDEARHLKKVKERAEYQEREFVSDQRVRFVRYLIECGDITETDE